MMRRWPLLLELPRGLTRVLASVYCDTISGCACRKRHRGAEAWSGVIAPSAVVTLLLTVARTTVVGMEPFVFPAVTCRAGAVVTREPGERNIFLKRAGRMEYIPRTIVSRVSSEYQYFYCDYYCTDCVWPNGFNDVVFLS